MEYKIVEEANRKYIEMNQPITCESDVLDIIGICISNDIQLVVLRDKLFTKEFIDLKSGLAGMVLQKFMNYHIKVAATIEDTDKIQGRFKELLSELNRTNDFKVFTNITDAKQWILNINSATI